MRLRRLAGFVLLGVILVVTGGYYWLWPSSTTVSVQGIAVAEALGNYTETEGYARAVAVRHFTFPADHGAHPNFRNEWWYATGNVFDPDGRHFGYQLTLFRIAIVPPDNAATELASTQDSAWRTQQVYMGHFALTDAGTGQHYFDERFSRAAAGLAGAENSPFRVWLENWMFVSQGTDFLPLQVTAETPNFAIDFQLDKAKPRVLQGNQGLSQKSNELGNASYYYSYTRLPTQGSLRVGEQTFQVRGNSWLDREWSTSVLGPKQQGWDWFALQLGDGREIMFYQLRHADGKIDALSQGVLVEADGTYHQLTLGDVELSAEKSWRSPKTMHNYPVIWRMVIPAESLVLTIRAVVEAQEMLTSVHYWEGAVTVEGHVQTKPISGYGYLEMTGYDAGV